MSLAVAEPAANAAAPSPVRTVVIKDRAYAVDRLEPEDRDVIAACICTATDTGESYVVSVSASNGPACTCGDWVWRKGEEGRLCKHLASLLAEDLLAPAEVALNDDGVVIGVRRRGTVARKKSGPSYPTTVVHEVRTRLADRMTWCEYFSVWVPAELAAGDENGNTVAEIDAIEAPFEAPVLDDADTFRREFEAWVDSVDAAYGDIVEFDDLPEPTDLDPVDPIDRAWHDGYCSALLAEIGGGR